MTDPIAMDEPDKDGPLFSLMAKIGLTIDTLSKRIQRQSDMDQMRLDGLPRIITFEQIIGNGAGTTAFLDLGSPPPGRVWEVRLLGVQSVAGTGGVTWYVGANMQVAPGLGIPTSTRWNFPTVVTNFETFSQGQITVLPMQHLMVGAVGLAPNTPVAVVATVADMPLWSQYGLAAIG